MKHTLLDKLVAEGTLQSYRFVDVDENGEENKASPHRNTQKLTLNFPNGQILTIDTFCSGSLENTALIFT